MIAYFVHHGQSSTDTIYLPEKRCCYPVDRTLLAAFLGTGPDSACWSEDGCIEVPPEEFGEVIALRDENGDMNVINHELWQQRLTAVLGN
jgi:hypothetical protein